MSKKDLKIAKFAKKETRQLITSTIKGLAAFLPVSNPFLNINKNYNISPILTFSGEWSGIDRSIDCNILSNLQPPLTLAGWLDMIERAFAVSIIDKSDAAELITLWNTNGTDPIKQWCPPLSAKEIKTYNTRADTVNCCKCGEPLKNPMTPDPKYKHCPKCEA